MKKSFSVNFIFKMIFIILLILTCMSYVIAIKISMEIGREQAKETHAKLLDLYMDRIDASFLDADSFLISYISTSDDILTLAEPQNDLKYELAKVAVHQDLANGALLHSGIDAFFYYNLSADVYIQARSAQIQNINIYLKPDIRSLLESGQKMTSGWQLVQMQNEYYMIRMEKYKDSYVGAFICLESIVKSLKETYQKDGGDAVIFDKEGKMLTHTVLDFTAKQAWNFERLKCENGGSFLKLCQESGRTPLVIAVYISENVMFFELQKMGTIFTILIFVIVMLIAFAMLILKRTLFHPLFELYENMREIKDGNLTLRMRPHVWQHEFYCVYRAFNDMMDEVHRLKIDVYEQQIKYQKMWLQYLQVQVRPHFFLNTLNLVYSMSRLGQNELIQKLSLHLVAYFRYLFREPLSWVTLETELIHVKNYLEIQKMRFPGKFDYYIQFSGAEKNTIMPPMIIQTFVENSIKHAGFISKKGIIHVIAKKHGPNVELTISDNGKGFSVEMLKVLNDENKTISKDKIYNIGIDNARLRLKLFFANNYYNMYYNSSGAVVKLVIPYMEAKDNVQCDSD